MQEFRDWTVRCVWWAAILTLGCAIFGSLWSGLYGLGDADGARFCRGIFWGFAACWSMNLLSIIGLLTTQVLKYQKIE